MRFAAPRWKFPKFGLMYPLPAREPGRSPSRDLIVVWGALPKPTGKEVIADQDFFASATAALR